MQEVAASAPAMRTQYEENLRRVNDSIRDAQSAVTESPNDEEARRALMDAYQQKSMLFEMAMDRNLQ
jgi:threonine synthase